MSHHSPVAARFSDHCGVVKMARDRSLVIDKFVGVKHPLHSAFGVRVLVAAVRRVRQPGAKFDHILVLEGSEGTRKSTAITILAGDPRNFSDQTILGTAENKQQELVRGKWISQNCMG